MRVVAAALACLLLVACGVEIKPGERSHARREIPPGAGLFTGKQGEFVIFRLEDESEAGEPGGVTEERPEAQNP